MKKNILLLYPDVPSQTKAAGHKSAFQTIEELYAMGHTLHLITFDSTRVLERDRLRLEQICKSVTIFPLSSFDKFINCIAYPWLPPLISSRIASKFMTSIKSIIESCDTVHIEFSQMLYYVYKIKCYYPAKELFFYSHDIIAQKAYREAKLSNFLNLFKVVNYLLTRFFEKYFINYADTIVVFNQKDARLLEPMSSKLYTIPLYTDRSILSQDTIVNEKNSIAFFGAMNRKENYLAAIEFIKFCWPAIHLHYPILQLLIIGANPPAQLLEYNGKENIIITNFVENPYELITNSIVTVAPITLGAGLKVKVLESLMCGCPVVAFPAGSEGIELKKEEGLVTVNNYEEMIKEVILIVSGNIKYNASDIKNNVNAKFNWQKSIEFFKAHY